MVEVGRDACTRRSSSFLCASVTNKYIIGLYGIVCPELLAGLIGILSVPAAYLPLSILEASSNKIEVLWRSGVRVVVVQESFLDVSIYLWSMHIKSKQKKEWHVLQKGLMLWNFLKCRLIIRPLRRMPENLMFRNALCMDS